MNDFSIFHLGDQAVTLSLASGIGEENHDRIISMKNWLMDNFFPGLLDVIVAYASITVVYDIYQIKNAHANAGPSAFVIGKLREAHLHATFPPKKKSGFLRIPVCYEHPFSPDLQFVCDHAKADKETVIGIHSAKTYRVYMIGFLPGFPYLGEVDQRIAAPRKTAPRAKVDGGSVGIAGVQTGIYPLDSPGGWQIIGKTPLQLFTKDSVPPVILEPGDSVQFYPISKKEFENFSQPIV